MCKTHVEDEQVIRIISEALPEASEASRRTPQRPLVNSSSTVDRWMNQFDINTRISCFGARRTRSASDACFAKLAASMFSSKAFQGG